MSYRKLTIYTLGIAIITLFSMIPGGPVENRSFANVIPAAALGLNIFIGSTLVLAFLSVFFMSKKQKWAYQAVGLIGINYILIFVLDLGKIFPVSLDEMSNLLFNLEIFALLLGILMVGLSYLSVRYDDGYEWASNSIALNKYAYMTALLFALIFFAGVYFSTMHALE